MNKKIIYTFLITFIIFGLATYQSVKNDDSKIDLGNFVYEVDEEESESSFVRIVSEISDLDKAGMGLERCENVEGIISLLYTHPKTGVEDINGYISDEIEIFSIDSWNMNNLIYRDEDVENKSDRAVEIFKNALINENRKDFSAINGLGVWRYLSGCMLYASSVTRVEKIESSKFEQVYYLSVAEAQAPPANYYRVMVIVDDNNFLIYKEKLDLELDKAGETFNPTNWVSNRIDRIKLK